MTKIQKTIFDTVAQSGGHVTAEQVLCLARQVHPSVSLSTVYRNLNIFADAGKIRRIQRTTGADYYEKNLVPHDHAYCLKCGKVSDFFVAGLKSYLANKFEHPIVSFELLVNYVCPDCLDK